MEKIMQKNIIFPYTGTHTHTLLRTKATRRICKILASGLGNVNIHKTIDNILFLIRAKC